MERYDNQTNRNVYMTNEECDEKIKEILQERLRRINQKLLNIEAINNIHTNSWRKLMKQKLYIIRELNKQNDYMLRVGQGLVCKSRHVSSNLTVVTINFK